MQSQAEAIDWPTFQGNNARTGVCDYPSIKAPEIAWSAQVGIMGYLNCPVIDGDRVFVTSSGDTHNKPDQRDGVYCLDLKTGKILWHYKTPIDACGITIDRDRVYAGDDKGGFHAIDRKTGKRVWRHEFNASVFGQPLRIGDLVVAGGAEGMVIAFDPATGKKAWSRHYDGAIRAGLSSDGKQIFVAYLHGWVVCLDLNGKRIWQQKADEQVNEFHVAYPAPTVIGDKVYFGFARGTYYDVPAFFSYGIGGELHWANQAKDFRNARGRTFGNIRSSAAGYKGSLIYAEPYGNELTWVDQKTGTFQKSVALGAKMFPQWCSPVIAKGLIYIPRHDGGLYAVDAQTAKQQWMLYLGEKNQAGRKSLPDDLMPEDWKRCAWAPNVGKPIYATPAIGKDGTLVIGTGEGWLYGIRDTERNDE